jgi:N-acetylglucosamine-6-phosphate deacetylase
MKKGFKNSWILTESGLKKTNLIYEDGKIVSIGDEVCEDMVTLPETNVVCPGFIDEHIHGAGGSDAMDGTQKDLKTIAKSLASEGTTVFCTTTMTQSVANITKALNAIRDYIQSNSKEGAQILGVHLEGPFISPKHVGAQPLEYVQKPEVEAFKKYNEASGNNIKVVTLAPEVDGAKDLIHYLSENKIVASVGHTDATYQDVEVAHEAGASNFTHTYNAMRALHHREVGTVGSAYLFDDMTCECICDGIHVSIPAIRLLYKNKPAGKMVLITDAMRAKGMPDGQYELGGQEVFVKEGQARLKDGTLAGSVLRMNVAVRNVMKFCNLSLAETVKLCTINVAKNLGIDSYLGSLRVGKRADFTIVDGNVEVQETIREGNVIYKA